MTIKQKLFVKHYVDSKGNGVQAAMQAYGKRDKPVSYGTANEIARENLQKPVIKSALAEFNGLFESTIVKAVSDWGNEDDARKREVAINTAKWGYEQIHGKATQRTESVSASFISHTSDKAKQYNLDA